MTQIIGISGKIGTGKSTVARMLLDELQAVDAWRDFGDELKREVSEKFGFPLKYCYTPEGKETVILHHELPACGQMTVRSILQWHGEVRRKQDPQHWVRELQEWMLANRPNKLVIGDVRYREEAAWIARHSGKLFRIEPYPEWRPGTGARHKSETDLDSWKAWRMVFYPRYGKLGEVAEKVAGSIKPRSTYALP